MPRFHLWIVAVADGGDLGRHKLQDQAVRVLETPGGQHSEPREADLEVRMGVQPAKLTTQPQPNGVTDIADGHGDRPIPRAHSQARVSNNVTANCTIGCSTDPRSPVVAL